MMSEPAILTAWLGLSSVLALLVGAAPLLAATRFGATSAPPDRTGGMIAALVGLLYLLSGPVAVFAIVARFLSWDSAVGGDLTGSVILLTYVPLGIVAGLASIRTSASLRSGLPTTRINATALAIAAAWVFGTGVGVALEPVGRGSFTVGAVVFVALAALVIRAIGVGSPGPPDAARSRIVGSSVALVLVLGSGAAFVLWVAGELGDRLSNHRSADGDAFYAAMQLPMFAAGGALALACLLAIAGAALGARRSFTA